MYKYAHGSKFRYHWMITFGHLFQYLDGNLYQSKSCTIALPDKAFGQKRLNKSKFSVSSSDKAQDPTWASSHYVLKGTQAQSIVLEIGLNEVYCHSMFTHVWQPCQRFEQVKGLSLCDTGWHCVPRVNPRWKEGYFQCLCSGKRDLQSMLMVSNRSTDKMAERRRWNGF